MAYSFDLGNLHVQFVWEKDTFRNYTNWDSPPHFHFFYEVHFLLEGAATLVIGDDVVRLGKGDVCIVPPNMMHYQKLAEMEIVRTSAYFSMDRKAWNINADQDIMAFADTLEKAKSAVVFKITPELLMYHNKIQQFGQERGFIAEKKVQMFLSLLFLEMVDCALENRTTNNKLQFLPNAVDSSLELTIDNFFSEQYMNKVTVEDLAKRICYGRKQTERIIKKLTGKTFNEVLVLWRMETAKMLLLNSDESIGKISEMVGYDSYGGFFKAFRATYQMNPQDFRSQREKC